MLDPTELAVNMALEYALENEVFFTDIFAPSFAVSLLRLGTATMQQSGQYAARVRNGRVSRGGETARDHCAVALVRSRQRQFKQQV